MTRREEKRLATEVAEAAAEVAKSGLSYAEVYFARVRLVRAIEALTDPALYDTRKRVPA